MGKIGIIRLIFDGIKMIFEFILDLRKSKNAEKQADNKSKVTELHPKEKNE